MTDTTHTDECPVGGQHMLRTTQERCPHCTTHTAAILDRIRFNIRISDPSQVTGVEALRLILDEEGPEALVQAVLDAAPSSIGDFRRIDDPQDRCPECGGYGRRGCGALWHDSKPDTHCSPVCECQADMRTELRALRAELELGDR